MIDPAREVYQDRICETTERLKNMKLKTVLIYMLQGLLSLICLWLIMLPPYGIQSSCDSYKNSQINGCKLSSIDLLCQLSSDGRIMEKPFVVVLFLIFVFIRFGIRLIVEFYITTYPEHGLHLNQSVQKIYRKFFES